MRMPSTSTCFAIRCTCRAAYSARLLTLLIIIAAALPPSPVLSFQQSCAPMHHGIRVLNHIFLNSSSRCASYPHAAAAAYGQDVAVQCRFLSRPLQPRCHLSPPPQSPLHLSFTVDPQYHNWHPLAEGGGVSHPTVHFAAAINTHACPQLLTAVCPLPPRTRFLSLGGSLSALAEGAVRSSFAWVHVSSCPPPPTIQYTQHTGCLCLFSSRCSRRHISPPTFFFNSCPPFPAQSPHTRCQRHRPLYPNTHVPEAAAHVPSRPRRRL
jgi:hypothetical protein